MWYAAAFDDWQLINETIEKHRSSSAIVLIVAFAACTGGEGDMRSEAG